MHGENLKLMQGKISSTYHCKCDTKRAWNYYTGTHRDRIQHHIRLFSLSEIKQQTMSFAA